MANNDFDPLLGAPAPEPAPASPAPLPSFDLSDPAVRLDLQRRYFESDLWKQKAEKQALRDSRMTELRRLQEPPGFVEDTANRILRGLPRAGGAMLKQVSHAADILGPSAVVGPGAPYNPRAHEMLAQDAARTPEQRWEDIEGGAAFKAGEFIEEQGEWAYPVDPKRDATMIAELADSLGSSAVPLVAGAALGPVGFMTAYALQGGRGEVERTLEAGKPENADLTFLTAAGWGAFTELALGLPGKLFKMIRAARGAGMSPQQFGKSLRDAAKKLLKNAADSVVREAGQEGLEQFGYNVIQKFLGDEDTPLSEGVLKSMLYGGILGPIMGGPFQVAGQIDYSMDRAARYPKALEQRAQVQQARGQRDRAQALSGFYDQPEQVAPMAEDPGFLAAKENEVRLQDARYKEVMQGLRDREMEANRAFTAGEITQEQFMNIMLQTSVAQEDAAKQADERQAQPPSQPVTPIEQATTPIAPEKAPPVTEAERAYDIENDITMAAQPLSSAPTISPAREKWFEDRKAAAERIIRSLEPGDKFVDQYGKVVTLHDHTKDRWTSFNEDGSEAESGVDEYFGFETEDNGFSLTPEELVRYILPSDRRTLEGKIKSDPGWRLLKTTTAERLSVQISDLEREMGKVREILSNLRGLPATPQVALQTENSEKVLRKGEAQLQEKREKLSLLISESAPPAVEPQVERPQDAIQEQIPATVPPQPAPEAGAKVGEEVPSQAQPAGAQVQEAVAPPQVGTLIQATAQGQPLTLRYDGEMMGMEQYTVQGQGVGRYIRGGTFMRRTLEKEGVVLGGAVPATAAPAPEPAIAAADAAIDVPQAAAKVAAMRKADDQGDARPGTVSAMFGVSIDKAAEIFEASETATPDLTDDPAVEAAELIKGGQLTSALALRGRYKVSLKEAWAIWKRAKLLAGAVPMAPMPQEDIASEISPELAPPATKEIPTEVDADLPPEFGSKNKIVTRDEFEAIMDELIRKSGETQMPGYDLHRLKLVVRAMTFYAEGGIRAFADLAKRVVQRAGKINIPYLKDAYRMMRDDPKLDYKGMDDDDTVDRILESDPLYRPAILPEAPADEPASVRQQAAINASKERPHITLKQWLKFTIDQMREQAAKEEISVSELAIRVGRHLIKTEEDLFDAVQAYRRIRLAGLAALDVRGEVVMRQRAGPGEPPKRVYINDPYRKRLLEIQHVRQSIEAATGVGETGLALSKDPAYKPSLPAVNFDALRGEDKATIRLRLEDPRPLPPAAPGGTSYPRVRTIRQGAIEQLLAVNPDGALQDMATWDTPASPAELAYASTMIEVLRLAETKKIDNAMRNTAYASAKKYGYSPVEYKAGAEDLVPSNKKLPEPRYPTIAGTPKDTPTGDRMYRTVHKLANGVRTVSIEGNSPVFPHVTAATRPINAAEAAVQDHIVWTTDGKFSGFRGFTEQGKGFANTVFGLIERNPSPEYHTVPVDDTLRWGQPIPKGALTSMRKARAGVISHTHTTLTENQLKHAVEAIGELEDTPDAYALLDNFKEDVETPGQNDSRFVRTMMYLRQHALFSSPYKLKGIRYVNATVPGVIKEMRIPIGDAVQLDTVYMMFINTVADALSVRSVQIGIRGRMGIPTQQIIVSRGGPQKVKPEELSVGTRVSLRHQGRAVKGIIKQVRVTNIPRTTAAGVTEGILRTETRFDVQLDGVPDSKGAPTVTINVPVNKIDALDIDAAPEFVTKHVTVSPIYRGQAKPDAFDGEPFESGKLLNVPLREWYAAKPILEKRKAMAKTLRESMGQAELLKLLYELGMRNAPEQIAADQYLFAKNRVNLITRARNWARNDQIPVQLWRKWDNDQETQRNHGKLASLVVDRVHYLYELVAAIDLANRRIKERASNLLLGIADVNAEKFKYGTALQPIVEKVKRAQAKTPSQLDGISVNLQQNVLPPAHEGRTMTIRLVNRRTWEQSSMRLSDADKAASTRAKLGDVLVRVVQTGKVKADPDELKFESSDEMIKSITPVPQQAYVSVQEDGKANIEVYDGGKWRTIYWVDLNMMEREFAAERWERKITNESGKPITIRGWYLNPKVLANSGHVVSEQNLAGTSRWNLQDKDARDKKFQSIEDYYLYIGKKLVGDSESLFPAPSETPGATTPTQWVEPPSSARLMDQLEAAGEQGQRLVYEMETGSQSLEDDTAWNSIADRAIQILGATSAEYSKIIRNAVDDFRAKKIADMGGMGNVSGTSPTTADADPALIGQKVKGKQALRALLAAPGNGLDAYARGNATAFIDSLPEELLADLELMITKGQSMGVGNVHRLRYAGSYSHLHRMVRIIANSGSESAAVEEIAHALAQFLPEEMRQEVERQRQEAIAALDNDEREIARQFASMLRVEGGAITSRQFMNLNRTDLLDFYPLINTDEFFAHNLTEASLKANTRPIMKGIVEWAKNWIKEVILALRRMLGSMRAQREMFFDRLLTEFQAGRFVVSVRGGYLHEVNKDSDLGAIFARNVKEVEQHSAMTGQRSRADVGDILAGEVFSFRELVSKIESDLTAKGVKFTPRAINLIGIKNIEGMLLSVQSLFGATFQDIQGALATARTPGLRNEILQAAFGLVKHYEGVHRRLKESLAAKQEYVDSPQFAKVIAKAAKAEQKAMDREEIAKEINAEIDAAINAALEAQRARAYEQSAYDFYREKIRFYEDLRGGKRSGIEGVVQAVEQMVAALSGTATGFEALQNPRVTPRQILKEWTATQPPKEQLQRPVAVLEFAAFIIAGRTRLRQQLAAAVYAQDQAVWNALVDLSKEAEALAGKLNRKKPGPAIRAMLRREAGAFTAYGKALAVLQNTNSTIRRKYREIEDYEAAVSFHEQLQALPEYKAYYNLLAQEIGEKRLPPEYREYGLDFSIGHKTLVPTPLTGDRVEISINTDKDAMAMEQAKAAMVLQEIDIWLADPKNADSIDYDYFMRWRDALDLFTSGANYTEFSRTWMGGIGFINDIVSRVTMLVQAVLRQYDTIAMTPIMRPIRQWIDSALLMQDWAELHSNKIVLALEAAANSHPDIIRHKDQAHRVMTWEQKIGQHLKGMLQAGYEFVVGDPVRGVLLNGELVTKEDLAAVRIAADATWDALNQDLIRGRILFGFEGITVEEQLARGNEYQRKPLRHNQYELPRRFNNGSLLFTKRYMDNAFVRLQDKGDQLSTDPADIPARRTAGRQLLNESQELLWAFLWHREPSFAENTAVSRLYPAALQEYAADNFTTVEDFEAWLDANMDVEEGDPSGSEQFWQEFDRQQERIDRLAVPEDTTDPSKGDVNPDKRQENNFTMARGNAIAPYAWYKYGFIVESDLVNFTLNGSGYFLTQVQKGITQAIKILEAKRDDFTISLKEIAATTGDDVAASAIILRKENRQRVRAGKDDVRVEELEKIIDILGNMKKELVATYLPHGRETQDELSRIRRIAGVAVGGVLISVKTALKNLLQTSLFYNFLRIRALGFGFFRSLSMATSQSWKQQAAAVLYAPWNTLKSSRHLLKAMPVAPAIAGLLGGPVAAGVAGAVTVVGAHATKENRRLQKAFWKQMYRTMVLGKNQRGRARGFAEIISKAAVLSIGKAVEEFSIGSLAKMRHYAEMERRGIMLRMNVVERGMRMAQSLETSGKLLPSEALDPKAAKFGMAIVGMADLAVTIAFRPVFPRSGDKGGNYAAVATTFSGVQQWQHWLLKKYLQMKDAGIASPQVATLEPWHIIPTWWGKSRNQRALQNIILWFRDAGMDAKLAINDYFKRLEQAPTPQEKADVEFLTEEQTYNLAQSAVEQLNQATPANRSMIAKKNTWLSIAFQLQGWSLNMFSVIMKSIGQPTKTVGDDGKTIRGRLFVANMWFIMLALAAGALSSWETRWVYRWLAWFLHNGEEQPQRQPWEAATSGQATRDVIADAFDPIPYVATFVSSMMRDQGPRRGQSINLWAQNWAMGLLNYVSGAVNSGDWRYGLDNLIRRNIPESRILLNRLPQLEGRYEAMSVQSILARNADQELILTRPSFGGTMSGATATSLTPFTGRMINAAMTEDYATLRQTFEEAVETAMEDRDMDRKEAEQLIRQNYSSRNPYNRVFKRKLTSAERQAELDRMTPSERQRVLRMEDRLRRGANAIGGNITFEEAPSSSSYRSSYGGRRSTASLLRARAGGGRARILRGRLGRRLTRRLTRA